HDQEQQLAFQLRVHRCSLRWHHGIEDAPVERESCPVDQAAGRDGQLRSLRQPEEWSGRAKTVLGTVAFYDLLDVTLESTNAWMTEPPDQSWCRECHAGLPAVRHSGLEQVKPLSYRARRTAPT